jgi:hypothetical protein
MAEYDERSDRVTDEQKRLESGREAGSAGADDYELTAKDAGWRTPTFLISPAKLVYFDPPRPKGQS